MIGSPAGADQAGAASVNAYVDGFVDVGRQSPGGAAQPDRQ
jgi:hypothetical protein